MRRKTLRSVLECTLAKGHRNIIQMSQSGHGAGTRLALLLFMTVRKFS